MGSIIGYDLDLAIIPEAIPEAFAYWGGRITATASLRLDLTADCDRRDDDAVLEFALYRLLKVHRIKGGSSGPVLSFTTRVEEYEDCPTYQARVIAIRLADLHVLKDGAGQVTINIEYEGPICGAIEALPYVHDHVRHRYTLLREEVLWFPVLHARRFGAQFRARVPYALSLTCPADLVPVTGGTLMHSGPVASPVESTATAWTRWEWQATRPTFMAISCAGYLRLQSENGRVRLYCFPEHATGAAAAMSAVNTTVELCTQWLGPVAPEDLAIAEIPAGWGSQSSPLLILQTADAFADTDSADGRRRLYSALGHEIAHAWSVPSREAYPSRFLDESITHFIEAMLLGAVFGNDAYSARLATYRERFLRNWTNVRDVPIIECGNHHYGDVISRGKGPWLLAVLREMIGDDRLFVALREFTQNHLASGATPLDFAAVVGRTADLDLSGLFADWLCSGAASSLLLEKHDTPAAIATHYRV